MDVSEIKVGPVRYKVEYVHGLMGSGDGGEAVGLLGCHDYFNKVIQVDATMPKRHLPITLLHEAIHGILSQAGQIEHPEGLVRAMAFGLATLIQDNPDLIEAVRAMEVED